MNRVRRGRIHSSRHSPPAPPSLRRLLSPLRFSSHMSCCRQENATHPREGSGVPFSSYPPWPHLRRVGGQGHRARSVGSAATLTLPRLAQYILNISISAHATMAGSIPVVSSPVRPRGRSFSTLPRVVGGGPNQKRGGGMASALPHWCGESTGHIRGPQEGRRGAVCNGADSQLLLSNAAAQHLSVGAPSGPIERSPSAGRGRRIHLVRLLMRSRGQPSIHWGRPSAPRRDGSERVRSPAPATPPQPQPPRPS